MGRTATIAATLVLLMACGAAADPSHTMSYQGVLRDDEGTPVPDDLYNMTFAIYDSPGGGTVLWTENQPVDVKDGVFNVILGEAMPIDLPFDDPYWLGITVDGEPELVPRVELAGAPYAMRSVRADTLQGAARVTDFLMSSGAGEGHVLTSDASGVGTWAPPAGSVGGIGDAGYLARFTGSETLGSSSIYENGAGDLGIGLETPTASIHIDDDDCKIRLTNSNTGTAWNDGFQISPVTGGSRNFIIWNREDGFISLGTNNMHRARLTAEGKFGIGTTSPYAHFDVESSHLSAGRFRTDNAGNGVKVLEAEYTGTQTYDGIAVYGESTPADWYGIGGKFVAGYTGVDALVQPTGSNTYYGVETTVHGGSGQNKGLDATAIGSGENIGVRASASGGFANYGVYASSPLGENDYAGFFDGDVHVTGDLTYVGAALRTDHPLDPGGKYLNQSVVAAPDMKTVLDGVVTLDGAGEAAVAVPAWFDALCGDFRYQLTCIGGYAPVYVAEKLSGGVFRIAGGEPGMDVSWLVTGVREDASARAHPVLVEEQKAPEHVGKYVDPDAYGAPASEGIHCIGRGENVKKNGR